ncbi:hypothetical protein GCM10027168_51910 [Streptomyces capparidis]
MSRARSGSRPGGATGGGPRAANTRPATGTASGALGTPQPDPGAGAPPLPARGTRARAPT